MPAVTTSMLAVNAAFLQEIKEDHRELQELFARLTSQFQHEAAPLTWRSIVDLLQSLRDRLAIHFALEEGYGYCEDAIEVAPRLSERAASLREEHPQLYMAVEHLVDCAEQILFREGEVPDRGELGHEFLVFAARFHEHERQECDLIQEAYEQDLGISG